MHRGLRPTSSVDAWQITDLDVTELVRDLERQADAESRTEIDALLAQRHEAAQQAAEGQS